jgi:cellulose synthase/poly-beta-1,6-N-acetylglucosamine synthase-like glycosyltransferase
VGGWDAYNVTEDCDLGLRLAEAGYTVTLLDSTTWEEANSRLSGWLKQRSRWVKGYLQTYLVHTRHPVALWRSLGLRKFLHFHLVIGGSLFSFFVNPLYWLVGLLWCVTQSSLIASLFVPGIYHLGLACFFLGNFAFLYLNMLACLERKFPDLVKHQFLLPGYWVLMSLAAYRGAAELLSRPHYWQKTEHGFHRDAPGHLSRSPNPQS